MTKAAITIGTRVRIIGQRRVGVVTKVLPISDYRPCETLIIRSGRLSTAARPQDCEAV